MSKNRVLFEGALTSDTRRIINENFSDVSICSTQLDATTNTTLADIPGMISGNLVAGTYRFKVNLAGTSGASGGMKVAFKFGTASMLTTLESHSRAFTASAVACQHVTSTTDQASLHAGTAAIINLELEGTLVIGTDGTLQLQMAQNASNGTTSSVYTGSYMMFTRVVLT